MELREVEKRNGKARRTQEVDRKIIYLDDNYSLKIYPKRLINTTGLLIIFEILPKRHNLPNFLGRWDENANMLDIDIEGVKEGEKLKFKNGIRGYSGHHAEVIINEKIRTFGVNIQIPFGKIFKGTISFTLHRDLYLTEKISLNDKITIT